MNTAVIMRGLNNVRSLLDGLVANLWGKRGKKMWRRRQRRRIFWFSGGPIGLDNVGGPGMPGGLGGQSGQDSLGDQCGLCY